MRSTMKAFFSYSTHDADLVHAVGRHVGRPFVTIDYLAFETGDDLLETIESAIHEAAMFVLFASRPALESLWVREEIGTARYDYAMGKLSHVLVFITDDTLGAKDLPAWLRRMKYSHLRASRPIAREVRHVIDEQLRARRSTFFIGRSREVATLQEALAPPDGRPVPRTLMASGLDGIGRQTLVRRVAQDLLTLRRTVRIDIESGDALSDIAAKTADLIEPYPSPEAALRGAQRIRDLDEAAALEQALASLQRIANLNELPVLYDRGGLLDNDGHLVPFIRQVLAQVEATPDLYVALVSNRRLPVPSPGSDVTYPAMAAVDVRPLSTEDVRSLISVVGRDARISLTNEQVGVLASQARGYPPAVYFAIELMKTQGPALVLQERDRVIAFRTSPFAQYLRAFEPQDVERKILRILSGNSPLPLEILETLVGDDKSQLPRALGRLIDASLVVPGDSTWYRIADPVVDAVAGEAGVCSAAEYAAIAKALDSYLRDPDDDGAFLALSRVRFRALILSGQEDAARQVDALAADWIQLAERLYHDDNYPAAIRAAEAAVEARPYNADALIWLIKALIKDEQFDEATSKFKDLRRMGLIKETIYHEGFLERHRGDLVAAADKYRRALQAGFGGIAIHRELAQCYFGLNNLEQAEKHIATAMERQPTNRFLIDLRVQIALAKDDADQARQLLEVLDQVDRRGRAAHRRSRVEDHFGNIEGAFQSAKDAVSDFGRPPFEVLAQFCLMAIKTGRHKEADRQLKRLDSLFPRTRRDIQTGLRCRAAIARGEFDNALGFWDRLENKNKPVHLALRRDALRGKINASFVPEQEASVIEIEIDQLNARLERVKPRDLELF